MKYIILLAFISGCSTTTAPTKKISHQCEYNAESIESKHAILSAKRQGGALGNCFKNFIKFETDKTQSVHICHTLNVSKNGSVTYSKINGINSRVSNDLKMCLEQSLWTMDFKSLQLSENLFLKFPLSYQSK